MKPRKPRKAKDPNHRSGLETAFQALCDTKNISVQYEVTTLKYQTPPMNRNYKPDWKVAPNIYVETKGYFDYEDRQKILLVREQHPEVVIFMLFQRPNNTITKSSKVTYGMWCDKHGIPWASFSDTEKWMAWIKEQQTP